MRINNINIIICKYLNSYIIIFFQPLHSYITYIVIIGKQLGRR